MKMTKKDKILLKMYQTLNTWQKNLTEREALESRQRDKDSSKFKKRRIVLNSFLGIVLLALAGIDFYIRNSIRLIEETISTLPVNATIEYRNELEVLKQTELFKAEVFSLIFFVILLVFCIAFLIYLERKGYLAYQEEKITNMVDTAKNTILDTSEKIVSSVKNEESHNHEIS